MTGYSSDSVRVVLRVTHYIKDPTRECLVAIGSSKPLGCWQEDQAVIADFIGLSTWQIITFLPKYQTTYWKWAVMERDSGKILQWEDRSNRALEIDSSSLMACSRWNGKDTILAIDPSVNESLRVKAAEALQAYRENKDKGKRRNSAENKPTPPEVKDALDANSNAGSDTETPWFKRGKYGQTRIPVKRKSPTCQGDAYFYNIHKSPDHERMAYEKTRYQYKKKPIKVLDDVCSATNMDTVHMVLNSLKPSTQGNISKIPVKVKYNKCCNCKFNDIMFSLRASMRSLQEVEDERNNTLATKLQTQRPKVSDLSSALLNLDKFEKSLKAMRTESPVEENKENRDDDYYSGDNVDITESPIQHLPADSLTKHIKAEPMTTHLYTEPFVEPLTKSLPQESFTKRPRKTRCSALDVLKYGISCLIVLGLAFVMLKQYLIELQCPSIVQSECMFSLW